MHKWEPPFKVHLIILIVTWLIIHLLLFGHYGVRNLLDSTEYLKRADFIIEHHRFEQFRHIFYSVPLIIITVFRYLSPDSIIPYLIFQSVLSLFAIIALYFTASKLFKNSIAGLCAGIIALLWIDNVQWNIVLMTESLFFSFTCFFFFCIVSFKGSAKYCLWTTACVLIIFLTRPTGIVVAGGALVFLVMYHWPSIKSRPILKLSVLAGIALGTVLLAYLMLSHWDFLEQLKKGNIVAFVDSIPKNSPLYAEELMVKSDNLVMPDSSMHPMKKMVLFVINNPVFFFKTSFLKVFYLVSAVRPYYSFMHNLYIVFWMTMIYALFYVGWLNMNEHAVKYCIAAIIFLNCLLIAVSAADWDNRFYIPMAPGIILMAGGGAAFIFKTIKTKYLKYPA